MQGSQGQPAMELPGCTPLRAPISQRPEHSQVFPSSFPGTSHGEIAISSLQYLQAHAHDDRAEKLWTLWSGCNKLHMHWAAK